MILPTQSSLPFGDDDVVDWRKSRDGGLLIGNKKG